MAPGGPGHSDAMTTTEPAFDPDNPPLQILEDDETVPPRPEEELADVERAEPDPH